MLETEDRPIGHEPPNPRRRPPGTWLLVAAAVAVVAIVGGLLVATSGDDDDGKDELDTANVTPTTAPARDIMELPDFGGLPQGRYFIDPDGDDTTPLRVTYEVAAPGWSQWIGAVKFSDVGHAGLTITTVRNVVTDGCRDVTLQDPAVGPTVDDLATALSQLEPFEVVAPPTDVTVLGHPGKHLVLKAPDNLPFADGEFTGCVDGNLHSYDAPNNGGPFYGYTPGDTEELWILDVEGTRLMIAAGASPGTTAQDLAERDAIFDSINIEP